MLIGGRLYAANGDLKYQIWTEVCFKPCSRLYFQRYLTNFF